MNFDLFKAPHVNCSGPEQPTAQFMMMLLNWQKSETKFIPA